MKISYVAVAVIIALQATTLLFNSQQRFVFHNTIHQISDLVNTLTQQQSTPCCQCFRYDEEIRYAMVAFMWASAFLLFTGEAVWPAFVSQALWIVFQSYLSNIRNLAVQLLVLYVLWPNLGCCGKSSNSQTLGSASSFSSEGEQSERDAKSKMSKQSPITDRSNSIQRTQSEASKTSTQKSHKEESKKKKNK